MCDHTSFRGNGGKARRSLLGECSVQSALRSPFNRVVSAALTPSAARCETLVCLLVCVIGFFFLAWRKFNALKHILSRPLPLILQLRQNKMIIFLYDDKNPDRHKACPDEETEISSDIRTPSRRGTRCRRPQCPWIPTAGRDLPRGAACRTTSGSRSRRS